MVNIAVSALFCSNEDWLADAIPASAFGGGFFGRMLVFYQEDTDRVFSIPRFGDPKDRVKLQALLKRVEKVRGRVVLTPDAARWYDVRYKEMKAQWPTDERLVPFWERLHIHLLRMGMLITISDTLDLVEGMPTGEDTIDLDIPALEKADRILGWILKYLPKVYVHVGGSTFGADHYRIYSIISRHGGMMEAGELGRKMARRLSKRVLSEHLDTMVANGVIRRIQINPWEGKYGWQITKKLED